MSTLLFPQTHKRSRILGMFCGSLIFHSALVGTAALWIHKPSDPPPPLVTEVDVNPPGLPPSETTTPDLPAPPAPPEANPPPPIDPPEDINAPQPLDDQEITEPVPPKPVIVPPRVIRPHPAVRTATTSTSVTNGVPTRATGGPFGATGSGMAGGGSGGTGWHAPKPAYTFALRAIRVQGTAKIRVTTDGSGRVADAIILKSSGNRALDEHTLSTVRSTWSGPANSTLIREIEYRLQ